MMRTSSFFMLILCVMLIFPGRPILFAQDQYKVDSLLNALTKASPEGKVDILLALSAAFLPTDEAQSIAYGQQAYTIAQEIGFQKGLGRAQLNEGLIYQYAFKLEEARAAFEEALKTFSKSGDRYFIAKTYLQIGNNLLLATEYNEALAAYEKALPTFMGIENKEDAANCIGNIGLVHNYLGNYKLALDFYLQGLALSEATNDKLGIAYSYSSIASIHGKLGNKVKNIQFQRKALDLFTQLNDRLNIASAYINLGVGHKKAEQYDTALFYLSKGMDGFTDMGHVKGMAYAFHNMGTIYAIQNDLQKALATFRKSNSLSSPRGFKEILSENDIYIADIFLNLNQLDSAEWYAQQGLQMAEAIETKEAISKSHLLLSNIYEQQQQYAAALAHHRKHLAYQDTLLNEVKSRQIQELEIEYETEQKEQQIALQESMLQNKTLIQQFLIVIMLLLVIASTAIFIIHRRRQTVKRKLFDEQLKNEQREKERAEELEQLKSHFYANIAHEFRTPLTLILGPAQNIQEQPENTSLVLKNTNIIERAAKKLLNLINQLLDLSKLESGEMALNTVSADFVPFIKGVVMSFESLAVDKDIKLELNSTISSVAMNIDPDRTDKIFYNLLSNAFKFTEEGGKVSVNINHQNALDGKPSYVMIKVSDSGSGIPEDQLPMIFDRFYQVEDSPKRHVEGTGIGLALTKELVDLHKGTITVERNDQRGTTFTVYLPVAPDGAIHERSFVKFPQAIERTQPQEDSLETTALSLNENIVLLIEDNDDVRKFIKDCLLGKYQILEAKNGKEGVAMAIAHIPDLIISDVMMPEMNGYEACKALKSDSLTSHIPIVMLTAKAGLDNRIEGLDTGADDYLEKPFNRKELLARIKNLIHTRKLLQEKYASENKVGINPDVVLPPKENQFISRVREIIDEHLDDSSFGVENLCKETGVSRTQLHRKIKALTDLSTTRFVRRHKLQKAVVLLKEGQYNISEVSYMTGFSSPSYFTQCFNEEFGHAPSEVS